MSEESNNINILLKKNNTNILLEKIEEFTEQMKKLENYYNNEYSKVFDKLNYFENEIK